MTRLARVDMDSVAPLMPFDKVAGRVAAKGEHFDWHHQVPNKIHSADPLPMRRPSEHERGFQAYVDLTGKKIGRFTVMGVYAEHQSGTGQRWVVRCVCGSYEVRRSKYIKACAAGKNAGDLEPMCDSCGYTRRLQMGKHNPAKAAAAAAAIMEAAR